MQPIRVKPFTTVRRTSSAPLLASEVILSAQASSPSAGHLTPELRAEDCTDTYTWRQMEQCGFRLINAEQRKEARSVRPPRLPGLSSPCREASLKLKAPILPSR